MSVSDSKVFYVASSRCAYRLVEREFSSRIVELVDERICVESIRITYKVREGEKLTFINAELFNSKRSSGW